MGSRGQSFLKYVLSLAGVGGGISAVLAAIGGVIGSFVLFIGSAGALVFGGALLGWSQELPPPQDGWAWAWLAAEGLGGLLFGVGGLVGIVASLAGLVLSVALGTAGTMGVGGGLALLGDNGEPELPEPLANRASSRGFGPP